MRDYSSEVEMRAFFAGIRQTIRCSEVRGILRLCARRKEFITYLDVARSLGMFSGGRELATCLGQIMEANAEKKEPLLSSLVIRNDTGRPGTGYFEQARSLGLLHSSKDDEVEAFWRSEVRRLGLDPEIADDSDLNDKEPLRVLERRPDGSVLFEGKDDINIIVRPPTR